MGLVDDITGKIKGQGEGAQTKEGSLLSGVMEMFSSRESGGLQGLLDSFHQKGLGDVVSSWVGRGGNRSITPEQVKEGIGSERISSLASRAGVSEDEAASKLSQHLPDFVDKLTPNGTVPQGGWLEKGMEFLKGRFGR